MHGELNELRRALKLQEDMQARTRSELEAARHASQGLRRLQEISPKGELRRHEAQVLQGLLQYASGFYARRSLRHASHILARVVAGLHFNPGDLSDFCRHTVGLLRHENPRVLSSAMLKDVIHLWTDGSREAGVAGIGLAAHDCFYGTGWVFEGFVPSETLEHWKAWATS